MEPQMGEYDDLAKRVAVLEAELAEAKKALEAVKPKVPFRPRMKMPKIDWTEGMRMPPDAAQKMAVVVPDVKGKGFSPHAWAQTKMGEPGGFGPASGDWGKGPTKVRPDEQLKIEKPPWSGWSNPNK
jgi:hypothetical protein